MNAELERETFEFPHGDLIDTSDLHDLHEEMREYRDLDQIERTLLESLDELALYVTDWQYGETLISDDYFEKYARQFAEDIGAISQDDDWPACHIDWKAAAESLKIDYTPYEIQGVTYWAR